MGQRGWWLGGAGLPPKAEVATSSPTGWTGPRGQLPGADGGCPSRRGLRPGGPPRGRRPAPHAAHAGHLARAVFRLRRRLSLASCGRLGHGVWGMREADIDTPNSASLGRGPWREHESIGQPDPVLRQGLALFWPVLGPTGWTGAPARSSVVGTRAVRVAPEGSLNAGRVAPWPSVVRRCPGLVSAAVVPLTNVRMVRRRLIIAQPATAAIRRSARVQPLLEGPRQQGSSRLDAPCLPRAIVTRDLPP